MLKQEFWADSYLKKNVKAEDALKKIKSGQRVFIGSSCSEPQHLISEIIKLGNYFADLEFVRTLSVDASPLSFNKDLKHFNIRSFYPGSAKSNRLAQDLRFITPINLSAVPHLFRTKMLPIDVALIQVTPPDDFGWMSLGVAVDINLAAAMSADLVIAQVNSKMPRVLGRSFIHTDIVDYFVEYDEEILTVNEPEELLDTLQIGKFLASHIEDGSTIHITPGLTPKATLLALENKNDLGVHTECLTDVLMTLVSRRVITNEVKGNKNGRLIASSAIGSKMLYDFIDDNPSIDFQPSDYVNNPFVISRHHKMVSINVAIEVDLTGQVSADAFPYNYFTGLTGMMDFHRGALMGVNGKSFIIMLSTNKEKTRSRIVPFLENNAVVVPRADVHFVVTEFGVVNLFGKTMQERAMAMISIAHPKFREELFYYAKEKGLIEKHRTLKESMKSVYPAHFEEIIEINGKRVTIRPLRAIDERMLQEHYYGLEKQDVLSRFFYEKKSFMTSDLETSVEIDYINRFTIVAVVGEFGFGKIIAVGEYFLNKASSMAEIAFSVHNEWQGKGLSKIVLKKLEQAAIQNKCSGLMAITSLNNKAMIKLFHHLPYKIQNEYDRDLVILTCNFADKEEKPEEYKIVV